MGKDEYDPFDDKLRRYRDALNRLDQLGLRVAQTSRLNAYLLRLERVTNDPNPYVDAALASQLILDLREIDELIEIVEALPSSPAPLQLDRLRLVHKGHENPDQPTPDKARDAQYELYLWAILTKGGLQVGVGEPDLIVDVGGSVVHVAAKRPSSVQRVDDRLRDALDQLERRPPLGIVAISLDRVIRPSGTFLAVANSAMLKHAVTGQVATFLAQHGDSLMRRVSGRRVHGLFLTTRLPGRTLDHNLSVLGTSLHIVDLTAPGTPERSAIRSLAAGVQQYLL